MQAKSPLNTWEAIIGQIAASRFEPELEKKIDLIIEATVNIRLLDKEDSLPDVRDKKESIQTVYARVLEETKRMLNSVEAPTDEYIYYVRELLKKLPIKNGGTNLISSIRSAAEYFEEGRTRDDPVLSFAGDLRRDVHRKLSPKILDQYLNPYLKLIRRKERAPLSDAGYMELASSFDPDLEPPRFVALAEEMHDKLSYLWNYETGDIATIKKNLEARLDTFEKCFLKREMQAFLNLCVPEYIHETRNLVDCLQRLISIKMFLAQSYREGRIDLFVYLNLDVDIGRLFFIFTNDLTNNHYEPVTFGNIKECIVLVKELILLLGSKGMVPRKNEFIKSLNDIYEMETVDILKTKRVFEAIAIDLQQFMQTTIFRRLSQMLNNVLEAYQVSTSNVLPMKDRFFNNFIRPTEFHAVNDFIERIIAFLNRELAIKNTENSLYGKYKLSNLPAVNGNYDAYVATTWTATPDALRPFLGGKGNGLVDMNNLGVKIPPAFILGLPICNDFFKADADQAGFRAVVRKYVRQLEEKTGKELGSTSNPLLLSVRSGTTISLPGVMYTILNVGLTPEIVRRLEKDHGHAFASNTYLRFLRNTLSALEKRLSPRKGERLDAFIARAERLVTAELGDRFLSDPFEQLLQCIGLIFASSRSNSVRQYLKEVSIEMIYGTAVTVQQMVFGNKDPHGLSGVIFTRNPISGSDELFGEFREMTQGEDVVMGNIQTRNVATIPEHIKAELLHYKEILERGLKHELDIEFTVEDNALYLLQTRRAAIGTYGKLVVDTDLLKKGIITANEFKGRIERLCATNVFISVPRTGEELRDWNPPIGIGVPINHGVAWGKLVLTPDKLDEIRTSHENVIFFSTSTKPSDFHMISNAHGIVTIFPGRTSHAAITSMTLNKPCMVGCSNAVIDLKHRTVTFKSQKSNIKLKEGELVTLDANGGYLYRGMVQLSNSFIRTADILDSIRQLTSPAEIYREVERIREEQLLILAKETGAHKRSIASVSRSTLAGKNILVRLDLNVPLSCGTITDAGRIEASLPTIMHLLDAGATPILCSHLGEPAKQEKTGKSREEIYEAYSLRPVADYLRKRIGDLTFHERSVASSGVLIKKEDLERGKVNLLENLRFAIGEKENDTMFARGLAALSDGIFVNDAFATCHRSHASIIAVTKHLDIKLAGLVVQKELKFLSAAMSNPQRPFVGIIGGSKISSKLGVLESVLQKIDRLIVGGGVGYTLLKAAGFDIQGSLFEESMLETAGKLLAKYSEKIVLPKDFVVTDKLDLGGRTVNKVERNVKTIPKGWESFDLGEESIEQATVVMKGARTILWNGPVGAIEVKEGLAGTMRLSTTLAQIAENGKVVIVTGGDSAAALKTAGVTDKMTHVSTGGSASLEFLERLTLPGIAVLDSE